MADLQVYDADDIARSVSMAAAIDGIRKCFIAGPNHIARDTYPAAGGEFLVMPAVDADVAGVKLLMIQPANLSRGEPTIQGTYVLFDAAHGRPVALLDGAALTRLRTPAASALATDALARHDSASLGIIGSGPQAAAHIEAILCVRPHIERVVLASRTHANAVAAVAAVGDIGTTCVVGSIDDAAGCDIVCVATRAIDPIVTAGMVRPGAHINAVGAYRADMREISADLLGVATVAVDELRAAQDEAGDLVIAVDAGEWSWDRVAGDLHTICTGATRRSTDVEITIFKSVGLAVEDLVIARLVVSDA